MASEPVHIEGDRNMVYQMVTQIAEGLKNEQKTFTHLNSRLSMNTEARTLTFWRAIISECLASFIYIFIVCGAAASTGVGASISSVLLSTSLTSGLSIAVLTHCFIHVSGAHINPAVTLACFVTRLISPFRTAMYIAAQLGGGIAGAALLYGVSLSGYQGNFQAAISHTSGISSWERFFVELILTFVVVFTYFVSTNTHRKIFGNSAVMIGAAYSACNFVSMPYLNPARSLGPSFVLNKWESHWIFWLGPLIGGAISAIVFEIIFNSRKNLRQYKDSEASLSMDSDEEINYDFDLEKVNATLPKFNDGNFNTYRSAQGNNQRQIMHQNMCYSMYQPKIEREPIYGGTKSLYCRSPPPTRANLHRSQSVYTKSNVAINRNPSLEINREVGLYPTQSLYPLRVAPFIQQNTHLQNQNVQNQLQQRSESIYGIRSSMRQSINIEQNMAAHDKEQTNFQPIYGLSRNNSTTNTQINYETREGLKNFGRRPESVYDMTNCKIQQTQSDDSTYGSYHGSSQTPTSKASSSTSTNFHHNSAITNQHQMHGMLPLTNLPNCRHQNHHFSEQKDQNERKVSISTSNTSSNVQKSVEFKVHAQSSSSGNDYSNRNSISSLPPSQHNNQQHQNYQIHSNRQN